MRLTNGKYLGKRFLNWKSPLYLCAIILALVWAAAPSTQAGAQMLYGTLTGTVTDASGAVISGAHITAFAVQTGVSQVQTSDPAGIYRLNALLPGAYKVTVTATGFSQQVTEGVTVRANETARVDAQLKVASATTNLTVTTEAPILQTDNADVHTDITSHQLENLTIMGSEGGNYQSLLRTIPGAGLTDETNSQAGNPQRAINANVNGLSQQGINTRVDGVQDAYPWLPSNVAYVPPAQAIETVQFVTNSFDAEQGMAGGAATNVQTKSGTNKFHGNAHEEHTDQFFAARQYFQTDPKLFPRKNRDNRNQFGGAVGGPIKRDKLFFFTDWERTTDRLLAGPDTRTMPTPAMLTGDFTNLPGNPIIYDPATGDQHGAGKTQISCNGVLNTICPTRFDPAAAAIVALLQQTVKTTPEFTTANDTNNWTGSGTAQFTKDNVDGKVTYIPTDRTQVWGRYSFSKTLIFDPPLLGPAIGDATNGGQLGNAPGLVQVVGVGVTHTLTPSLLFDWNLGFTRQRLGSTFDLTSARGLDQLKIPGTNNVGATGDPSLYYGWPGFTFPTGGPNIGNAQPANPFLFRDQQYVTGANLSWNYNKHAFRGGVEWNHSQINHFQPQGGTFQEPRGAFQFNGNVTALQGTTPTWFNSWGDFLLGLPELTGKARALFNPNALRWSTWSWYFQDHYQVTPKLTVTLGVRWEYYPFGYSDNGKGLRLLDLNTGNVILGGYGGVPRNDNMNLQSGPWGQFVPRLGAAYRLRPTTVLRVGYGVSVDPYQWHVLRNAYPSVLLDSNQPANTADFIPSASLTGQNGTLLGKGSYSVPSGIVLAPLPDLSSGSIKLPTSVSTTTFPNPWHRGFINSYNLSVEQQLLNNFTVNVGYVGTYDVRPVINMNANASLPGTGTAGGLLSQKWGANYTGGINELNPFLHSRYDSLQTQLMYRFAGGSNVTAAYTWSRTMDYADNEDLGGLAYPYYQNPAILQKNYAPSNFDRAHNLEISGVIAMPFGRGEPLLKTGPGAWILGGWLVNPIISGMSGFPFTVSAGGSLNANGSAQTADLIAPFKKVGGKPPRTGVTCAVGDPTCSYFVSSSFGAPVISSAATAHYGNTKRNEFRGPGFFNMNLSIVREFKIWEFATLQLRGDAVGFTNTPHFANPNASCPANANPVGGAEQACNTGTPNNFGVVTGGIQPGGFFGPDPGNRQVWLGATVTF